MLLVRRIGRTGFRPTSSTCEGQEFSGVPLRGAPYSLTLTEPRTRVSALRVTVTDASKLARKSPVVPVCSCLLSIFRMPKIPK